ncbi:glycosyltransferase family 39 protein [Hyphomicrobium sp.]|uniref:ArnT family glycosyltransferase n=1 Tax=Hyphomicrobium sp. TaxID=82 RepID=UPI0025C5A6BA|nr:glycosyltransferase family 39 protein [Hyphomicrobium sp.]MCC7254237.1 glycosyltransferase family 39 protein [Hyphomicrobium sp.]
MNVQREYVSATGDRHDGWPQRGAQSLGTGQVALFLGLLAVIAAVRLVALAANGTDLYMDEAQYWAWSCELALGYFSKPPLIAWIIAGTTSLCGDGEACIRLPSVVLHLATAGLVYALAVRLYAHDVAVWAGLGYALLPAVSLSSGIISTDVPLLAAWALALYAFAGLLAAPTLRDTALLALALGFGLNAKYAMAYFILCAAIYFVVAPERRARLKQPHLWLALAGGLALIAPNLIWNATNGFVTFAHTADNAGWRGLPFHPDKAAEFLLAQFGVFGPILFGALLVIVWRAARRPADLSSADKLLLAFSVPILVAVTAQGLISRAHANWAAPAYVAAIVLVTAVMIRDRAWDWMRASIAIHVALALLIAAATWQAGRFALPIVGDPFARTLGNRALADAVRSELAEAARNGQPISSVMTDDREIAAALAYYARDLAVPILSWRESPAPRSYFEMTRPFSASAPTPALLVGARPATPSVTQRFAAVTSKGSRALPAGEHATRTVHFSLLVQYQER